MHHSIQLMTGCLAVAKAWSRYPMLWTPINKLTSNSKMRRRRKSGGGDGHHGHTSTFNTFMCVMPWTKTHLGDSRSVLLVFSCKTRSHLCCIRRTVICTFGTFVWLRLQRIVTCLFLGTMYEFSYIIPYLLTIVNYYRLVARAVWWSVQHGGVCEWLQLVS